MKTTDLRTSSVAELEAKLSEALKELHDNRRLLAAGELASPSTLRTQRRAIATLKTLINERRHADTNQEKA